TTGAITASNFWAATHDELPFFPHAPGTTEEATVPGLQQGTTYWFALETSDEVPNWSTSSNSPSAVPGGSANLPPVASSVFSPSAPQALQAVTFNASSSYDPDGTIASYVWNFGDGGAGNGRMVAHAYGVAGRYTATLTVTDDGGPTAVQTDSVPVTAAARDTTPPATITDLVVSSASRTSVVLRWTAPGDDGSVGTATLYEFRYSTSGPITEANFPLAVHVVIPFPKAAGSQEQLTLSGLQRGTKYWFALKASDEVPNWSEISDSPIARTLASSNGRGRGPGACLVCLWENTADVLAAIGALGLDAALLAGVAAVGGLLLAVALLRRHSARKPETPPESEPRSGSEDEVAVPSDVTDEMIDDMIDQIMEPQLPRGGR
ncbi:MAG TPA: PKD domain-containing protein, partial [Thermoplasmata archaeon]|nr:PKD domain-containing protein [Thermoplasmata archaeon]